MTISKELAQEVIDSILEQSKSHGIVAMLDITEKGDSYQITGNFQTVLTIDYTLSENHIVNIVENKSDEKFWFSDIQDNASSEASSLVYGDFELDVDGVTDDIRCSQCKNTESETDPIQMTYMVEEGVII